jgi:hypothetical protein
MGGIRFSACTSRSLVAVVVGVLCIAACAQLPNQSAVQAFGQAASSASTTFNSSVKLNADLAQRAGENQDLNNFLLNRSSEYELPSQSRSHLGKAALQPTSQLIAAIGKYASALATASDPKTIQALQTTATSLAATVGSDVAPLLGPVAVPLVSPAAQLVGTLFGDAVTNEQALQIREVMRRTHPVLVKGATELKSTLAIIKHNNEAQLENWRNSEKALLRTIRDGSQVSQNAAVAEFRAAVIDAQNFQTSIAAMASYTQVLDAMVKAHASLIDASPGANADLANFLARARELENILSEIKK